ncbi:MAG TPA: ABC transporter permease [Candidatus Sulfotelmatobacter sp.]|nr:ABC transporter permease [Candidatus Sulfotelmatobacter sp.]
MNDTRRESLRPRARFRLTPPAAAAAAVLGTLYLVALLGPFMAPYGQDSSDRARFYQPPQRLHWVDEQGGFHLRPFVRPVVASSGGGFAYAEDASRRLPLRFLVHGEAYRWLGVLHSDRHLFGVGGSERVLLLGADGFGRDVLSRLIFGSQVSLTVGLVGIAISFSIGMLLGGISGYFGGWADTLLMRFCELLLSIPGLYLILALRSLFPPDLPNPLVYLGIVGILALVGWASLARVIRGLVLSIRESEYVAAAEALGMGRVRILVRHILPNTLSFAVVAATLAVPGYVLGEVALSFLGVGVQEPAASWGNMLNQARSLRVLSSFPWLLYAPGAAIVLTVMAYNLLGDGLRDALDPRAAKAR